MLPPPLSFVFYLFCFSPFFPRLSSSSSPPVLPLEENRFLGGVRLLVFTIPEALGSRGSHEGVAWRSTDWLAQPTQFYGLWFYRLFSPLLWEAMPNAFFSGDQDVCTGHVECTRGCLQCLVLHMNGGTKLFPATAFRSSPSRGIFTSHLRVKWQNLTGLDSALAPSAGHDLFLSLCCRHDSSGNRKGL